MAAGPGRRLSCGAQKYALVLQLGKSPSRVRTAGESLRCTAGECFHHRAAHQQVPRLATEPGEQGAVLVPLLLRGS